MELTKGMTPENQKDTKFGQGRFKMDNNHLGVKNATDLEKELENSNSGIMDDDLGAYDDNEFYRGFDNNLTKLAS